MQISLIILLIFTQMKNAPEYHVIVAGSLLGVAVNRASFSFPVGKVDIKTLYPMDMEEFMLAWGEDTLVEQIKKCFKTDTPLPSALHDRAMELYRQYLVIGGMPECVMQFVETKDYILVRHTQNTILQSYLNDMSKYNTLNEIKKTRLVYDNITVQLSKKNTRFQYKLIKKGGEPQNLKIPFNGSACLVLFPRFTRQSKSRSLLKTTVILTLSKSMFQTWDFSVQKKTWRQMIFSIW